MLALVFTHCSDQAVAGPYAPVTRWRARLVKVGFISSRQHFTLVASLGPLTSCYCWMLGTVALHSCVCRSVNKLTVNIQKIGWVDPSKATRTKGLPPNPGPGLWPREKTHVNPPDIKKRTFKRLAECRKPDSLLWSTQMKYSGLISEAPLTTCTPSLQWSITACSEVKYCQSNVFDWL